MSEAKWKTGTEWKSETEAGSYQPLNAQLAPFKAQLAKLGHTLWGSQ